MEIFEPCLVFLTWFPFLKLHCSNKNQVNKKFEHIFIIIIYYHFNYTIFIKSQ